MKLFSKTITGLALASIFLASCSSVDRIAQSNKPGRVRHTAKAQVQTPTPQKEILSRVDVNTLTASSIATVALQATPIMRVMKQTAAKAELYEAFSKLQASTMLDGKVSVPERKMLKKVSKAMVAATKPNGDGGKSQVIALILCILVGVLGVHRFYLGYMWQGVVQLLTCGGLGVWALIDLVMIITGDLKPEDGEYDVTF